MIVRKAERKDLKKLTEIYNYEVLHGTATFDSVPKTVDERKDWFDEHTSDNRPLIVAEENGVVLGYASLSSFNKKDAYMQSVELSLYVDKDSRRKHIGSTLMTEILTLAKNNGKTKKVISIITSTNAVSIELHKKFGFAFCGALTDVAAKFGKDLSVDYYALDV